MSKMLIFQLYGALAAWGESAVGEFRPSSTHPSRSSVLGLLAAALGLERAAEEEHAALSRSVGFGVLVIKSGLPLRDFHTAQVPPSRSGFLPRTRAQELQEEKLNAVLSTREYRQDGLWLVVLWQTRVGDPTYSLERLKDALEFPHFLPFLGRKSCVLGLPLAPELLQVESVREALEHRYAQLQRVERQLLEPRVTSSGRRHRGEGQMPLRPSDTAKGPHTPASLLLRDPLRAFPRVGLQPPPLLELPLYWEKPDSPEILLGVPECQSVERLDAVVQRRTFRFEPRLEFQGMWRIPHE